MPRDKTAAHEKIVRAARAEFLEKGYALASVKSIADTVGMTSAALYRHFESREAMFLSFVQPALDLLSPSGSPFNSSSDPEAEPCSALIFDTTYRDAHLVSELIYREPEAFFFLFFRSEGSGLEQLLHDAIERSTDQMMQFLNACRQRGMRSRQLSRAELHMLMSAYVSALLQPIEHRMTAEEAAQYLKTVMDFYTPGWKLITGL